MVTPDTNGFATPATTSPMAALRERPDNQHLLRGFGPLAVGIVLFVLMVVLAPTVAPEHIIEQPVTVTTTQR